MDTIFREEVASGDVIIYMDNILIATTGSIIQHYNKVAQILKKLQDNNLFLKPEKCQFHKQEVEYLGIIVGKGQVKMDPVKVKGIMDWPIPTNVSELRSFLGFGNYYKDFIPSYLYTTRPLYDLTKKNTPWSWEVLQDNVFQLLKDLFTLYLILRNPNPTKPYILDTNALKYAIEAVLSQDYLNGRHPIAYFSKSLLDAKTNYDIYDQKLLAIIKAVTAFRYLLLGAQELFIIQTDHENLKYFKSPQKISTQQVRWHKFLQDYNFKLEHFPGKSNMIADLLS
jgi:RNase H-like domain found in reverse transcriptase